MPTRGPERPRFLVDRSLGNYQLPDALRQNGCDAVTLRDLYGEETAQRTADTVWLERAGDEGWPVLFKDAAVLRRPHELAALEAHKVQAFCLMRQQLTGPEQVALFLAHLRRIINVVASREGPFMYGIYSERRMEEIWRPVRRQHGK